MSSTWTAFSVLGADGAAEHGKVIAKWCLDLSVCRSLCCRVHVCGFDEPFVEDDRAIVIIPVEPRCKVSDLL